MSGKKDYTGLYLFSRIVQRVLRTSYFVVLQKMILFLAPFQDQWEIIIMITGRRKISREP